MSIDRTRVNKFLMEIRRDILEIEDFLRGDIEEIKTIKAIKYNLVEIVEACANILQHILAKDRGIAAGGYLDVIERSKQEKIITLSTYKSLIPFFRFRNVLVHRYWEMEDRKLIKDVKNNYKIFYKLIKEIEKYISIRQ